MRTIAIILAALTLCGCASKQHAERSVIASADSSAVSTVLRAEGNASLGLWVERLDADSVRISTVGAEITVYGMHSSVQGLEAETAQILQSHTDTTIVNRSIAESQLSETDIAAIYDPPNFSTLWIIVAAVVGIGVAVIIYRYCRK